MQLNKRFVLSWLAGACLVIVLFYAATAWLWSAVRTSAASALENQVSSMLANDLAEGNLFKLGASLSRLMQAGSLDYAEIRSFSATGGWESLFRTHSHYGDTSAAFSGFSCGGRRRAIPHRGEGVSLVTVLPSNIEGSECVALFLSSDLPADLKSFHNKLSVAFGLVLTVTLAFFLYLTIAWHKRTLALEVAARTAEAEKEAALGRMAAQVAHDIRSPLAALESALNDMGAMPEEKSGLVKASLGRIGEIASDLLGNYRKPGAGTAAAAVEPLDLAAIIAPVLAEKRSQYAARPEIKIDFTPAAASACVQPAELRRIVSNLVNNAVEAFDKGGRVAVELARREGRVLLIVADDGKGITPEVLAKLGRKGGTHGKAGGTGLGLYHARTTVESWGGTLKIDSKPGSGTAVTIDLPAAEPAAAPGTAALLDDDALVRLNWKTAARAAGVELKVFSTPEEFYAGGVPTDAAVYLDSDLGGGVKGEDLAKELKEKGYASIRLETGHPPEKFAHLPWLKVVGKEPPWA